LFGRDRNDAADRVRAVEAALRPAQHFDAGNVPGQQLAEIERLVRIAGIGNVDAVDQDLDVVGVGPADEHRRLTAGPR
jgi:hypothetical protein